MIESVVRLCYNVAVTAALQPLMNKLERELEPLVDSGTNWQLTLHGGRNGHVIIEILRKDEVMLLASERSGRRFLFEGGVMPQQVTISTTARRLLRLAAQRSGVMPQQVTISTTADGAIIIRGVGGTALQIVDESTPPPPPPPPPPPDPDPEPVPASYIWVDVAQLRKKPQSGPAWEAMLKAARADPGTPTVSNQDSKHNTNMQANANVYACTGDVFFLNRVLDGLRAICSSSLPIGRALALAREIPGYIAAAEAIELPKVNPGLNIQFRAKLRYFLTCPTPGGGPKTLVESQEKRPNNWGTHASCARVMIARYLDDGAELARAVQVFKGYLGDWDAYHEFDYGDLWWQYDPDRPLGINPAGAAIEGHNVDGALPEELRRAGGFTWPPGQTDYYWEAEQGITATIQVLENAGLKAKTWSDWAHLRSVKWAYDVAGWKPSGDDSWQPAVINALYGTSYPVPSGASAGKNLGWAEFTHQ